MSPGYFSLFALNRRENKYYTDKIDFMKLSLRDEKIDSVNISYWKFLFMIYLLSFRVGW